MNFLLAQCHAAIKAVLHDKCQPLNSLASRERQKEINHFQVLLASEWLESIQLETCFLCLHKCYVCNIHMHLGTKHLERPRGDTSAD